MIYSTFQERPHLSYLLLGLVFIIAILEIMLAGIGIFPDKYDWILGCLLFGTTLAWMGSAALAGAVAPVSSAVMKYAYITLLAFSIAFVVSLAIHTALYESFDTEPDWLSDLYGLVGLILWGWMALIGLVGSLGPREISAKMYIPLVVIPLVTGVGFLGYALVATGVFIPLPDVSIEVPLLGAYGLAMFLLSRPFLSRLAWGERLRSNLLFNTMTVFTLALTIVNMVGVLLISDLQATTLFGLVIFAPFGLATLQAARDRQ